MSAYICQIVTNFICAGVSLLHGFMSIVPRQYLSLENEYYKAVAFYTVAYIHHWCVLMLDIKFFILGFERWFGFRSRATYEHSEDNTSIKIYCSLAVLAFCAVTTKVYLYLTFNDKSNETFRRAFVVEDDLSAMLASHLLALFGWIYAFVIFRRLMRQAEAFRFSSQSLSESYVIKETIRINTVIGPIVRAYLVMAIACTMTLAFNIYCMQYGYWEMRSAYYQSLTNVSWS
uniref:7TM_GPCR_Srx domain-containing protein n=1 Tax=Bursaphelenchus xylophilus TaxID=6326 RepID=A0A1I7RJK8_BURXY